MAIPNLIGVIGRKRSGKDTIAGILRDQYGFVRLAFAENVKKGCSAPFMFSHDQLHGDAKDMYDEELGVIPRDVMIYYSKLMRDKYGPDIWIKALERHNRELLQDSKRKVVISDVRYNNEAEWILSKGGILISVTRHTDDKEDKTEDPPYRYSASNIANDSSIENLRGKICAFIEAYGKAHRDELQIDILIPDKLEALK